MIFAVILLIIMVALLFGARAAKGCLLATLIALAILVILVIVGIMATVKF